MEEKSSELLTASSLWIGCCGWAEGRASYFKRFRTVEVQSTFYQPPAVDLARAWRQNAPAGFRFCLKAWQLITHPASSPTYRRLRTPLMEKIRPTVGAFQPTGEVWCAWQTTLKIADALDAAIVLFQCPASFRPTPQNVRNLETFFRRLAVCRHSLAWEPRGDWPQHLIRELCTELNLIHCVDPFAGEPVAEGIRYFRLHGRGGYRYQYTQAELEELRVKVTSGAQDETYVMFNNTWMKDDAARFQALLGRLR